MEVQVDEAERATPDPEQDRIDQRTLASLLGISERTASVWARAGRLRHYEHGVGTCGRRRYSRGLVLRERQRCWLRAVRAQDELLGEAEV